MIQVMAVGRKVRRGREGRVVRAREMRREAILQTQKLHRLTPAAKARKKNPRGKQQMVTKEKRSAKQSKRSVNRTMMRFDKRATLT